MTGLGTEIVRRDEIRLVEDTDGDGYADKATVFAGGFNSIQGLAYHDGTVYVMHAPFLTALRDTRRRRRGRRAARPADRPGAAAREEPARGCTAPTAWSSGTTAGSTWPWATTAATCSGPRATGWCFDGGGILRCRPDGRDLHVFATGLRNIYDVALDEELNVFVRDNENDGGDYKIRVCHSFFGADHGYPYLYARTRPTRRCRRWPTSASARRPAASATSKRQFPAEYRGNLFFCEWGRAVVRYRPAPAGSGFAPLEGDRVRRRRRRRPVRLQADRPGRRSATARCSSPTGPTASGRSGAAAASTASRPPDAAGHRTRPATRRATRSKRTSPCSTRRATPSGSTPRCASNAADARRLDAVRDAIRRRRIGVRGRLHAVWVLAHRGDRPRSMSSWSWPGPIPIRASRPRPSAPWPTWPTRCSPGIAWRRGPGDADLAARLAALADGRDPRVVLEVTVAVGRLRWPGAPGLAAQDARPSRPRPGPRGHADDAPIGELGRRARAPRRAGRRADARPARRALADRAEPEVVDGLIARLGREPDPGRRRRYADLLARVYKTPGPWAYWGYRPAPRPANTVAWERTEAIAAGARSGTG